jgi:hypothetical protein
MRARRALLLHLQLQLRRGNMRASVTQLRNAFVREA